MLLTELEFCFGLEEPSILSTLCARAKSANIFLRGVAVKSKLISNSSDLILSSINGVNSSINLCTTFLNSDHLDDIFCLSLEDNELQRFRRFSFMTLLCLRSNNFGFE